MNLLSRIVKEEEGQALTEYGLIIGLVSVVLIGALAVLSGSIEKVFNDIRDKLNPKTTP
ncbi:Flp family type IVb pilin [Bacillus sp. B-jedd]|uniref:Flp family type IVb pilin n=1 Tax=Bacillus sp. B-jedd TaxID=1476857 RepID=UPI0005155AB3|nr:Flp family type IVb pilin [Bacillus sp. B-jedd]CEG28323.1 Flp/Fap pilin component [Bacillus sp. B-jedd]